MAAQYLPSGQQNQLAWGQHPTKQSVSSEPQVVFTTDNFFGSKLGNLMSGQSSGVAAQFLLSGQQYQPVYGQHPDGHSTPEGQSSVFATFFGSKLGNLMAGQSSAVAAQYLLSGQQNQLASGQHPAGHSVSSGPQVVLTAKDFLVTRPAEATAAKQANAMKTFMFLNNEL